MAKKNNPEPELFEPQDDDRVILNLSTGVIEREIGKNERLIIQNTEDSGIVNGFNKNMGFMKMYNPTIPALRKALSPQAFIVALSISEFVCYQTCMLRVGADPRGSIYTTDGLAEALGMSRNVVRKAMTELKKKYVVAKVKTSSIIKQDQDDCDECFIVNPYLYFRGTKICKTVLIVFGQVDWTNALNIKEEWKSTKRTVGG